MKRLALRRGDTFIVFKDIKISLDFFRFFFWAMQKKNEGIILNKNCHSKEAFLATEESLLV